MNHFLLLAATHLGVISLAAAAPSHPLSTLPSLQAASVGIVAHGLAAAATPLGTAPAPFAAGTPPPPPPPPVNSRDFTNTLQQIFSNAPSGATLYFPPGTYNVKAGTVYTIRRPINLIGTAATLVNAHFVFLANVSINGLGFSESDCTFMAESPASCAPGPALIALGSPGYPITQASISNVNMTATRAYTAIALGFDQTTGISISNFNITDNQLSGITVLGGNNISITNGSITGGTDPNVDDGVALYSAYSELSNVTVSGVRAKNTFDAVGIGALLYWPMHDINVSNTTCQVTAVCIYVKAGDAAAPPSPYGGYSTLNRLQIHGVTDSDPAGSRHLSTLWIFAKGGAAASGISVDTVASLTRNAGPLSPDIWIFTDSISTVSNVQLSNMLLLDKYKGAASSATTPGQPAAEGLFLQDLGHGDISNLSLLNSTIDGTAYYAIDSAQALVSGLSITNSSFLDIDTAVPGWPSSNISYTYSLVGTTLP